jgi:hypothetical protein
MQSQAHKIQQESERQRWKENLNKHKTKNEKNS